RPRKRKSFFIAFLLWFFFAFLAAHKLYLGLYREAVRLILLYFFLPLGAVVGTILLLHAFGVRLVPAEPRPGDVQALIRSPAFAALTGVVLAVLTAIWIWDFRVLMRQVREHNEAAAREEMNQRATVSGKTNLTDQP
ncbi:MAG: NINE protein, partial [Candidatus Tectomicrobia bacterium]|nr:NINE protein [Candidatus Tectomicrobia bacterium]